MMTIRYIGLLGLLAGGCTSSGKLGDLPGEDGGGTGSGGSAGMDEIDGADETDETGETDGAGETAGASETGPQTPGTCVRYEAQPESGLEWALHCASPAYDTIKQVAEADNGDLIIAFQFHPTTGVEDATLMFGDDLLSTNSGSDIVLARLDPTGDIVWTQVFPIDDSAERVEAMTLCDGDIVMGWYSFHTSPSNHIERFDSDGNLVWSHSFEAPDAPIDPTLAEITCDSTGDIMVSGLFREGVDLGGGLIPGGVDDSFLARFTADGTHLWSRGFNANRLRLHSHARAPNDDFVVYGRFSETIDLGGGQILDSIDGGMFVARYTPAGDVVWSLQFDGDVSPSGIAIDDEGRIAITGSFLEALVIGGETFENVFPDANPKTDGTVYDAFVAMLTPDGVVEWVSIDATMLDDDIGAPQFVGLGTFEVTSTSSDGIQVDRYLDGSVTPLFDFGGLEMTRMGLTRQSGGRVLYGNLDGELDSALLGQPLVGAGGDDFLIAVFSD